MRHFLFVLPILLSAHAAFALSARGMPCQPDGDCSDPCAYFADEAIFIRTGSDTAKIKYKGQVHDLTLVSSKSLRKRQADAELPGDIERFEYSGKNIRLVLTQKILNTTCYEKNKSGRYESLDKCCGTGYRLILKVGVPGGTQTLETDWDAGC